MTFRRLARGCLLLAVLTCVVGDGVAQTDYSPRIRSLGTAFAGIVDDPFTDAFLNPARVGDMPGRGAWFGRLPSRSVNVLYPREGYRHFYGLSVLPPEDDPTWYGWSYSPYSLGFVTPVSSKLKLSLAGDLYVSGSNDLYDYTDAGFRYPPSIDDVVVEKEVRGGDGGTYHGLFDAALGSGSPDDDELRWGARATLRYDRSRSQSVRTRSTLRAEMGSEDVTLDYDYNSDSSDVERLSMALSIGMYKREGFLAQAVAGVDAGRETVDYDRYNMNEDDEDYDGDGNGPGNGNSPLYRLGQEGFESNRVYDTGRVFGRLGLRWGARVRSWHRLTINRSEGNGGGRYEYRDIIVEVGSERLEQDVSYALDGESSGYRFANSVGFVDKVLDNVLFACAVEAVIQHDEFEEDGDGDGKIQVEENGSSSRFEAPYAQRATYNRDVWSLSIPAAFEWEINEYAAWRFGIDFRASRSDVNSGITRDIDAFGLSDLGLFPVTNSDDDLRYLTSTYFSSGLTLSFRDRVKLELLTGPTSGSISVVYFSSAILEFRF
jgi:hypothetical protein